MTNGLNGLVIDKYGNKRWFKDDFLHREDGPAVECANGDKYWYINGNLHRLDGPAVEYFYGVKVWFIEGLRIICSSKEQFIKSREYKLYVKFKVFL